MHTPIKKYLEDYVMGTPSVVGVKINPSSVNTEHALAAGYKELNSENAYWWREQE